MSKLLVVDWDFFFPTVNFPAKGWELYDWSHAESPFLIDMIWTSRAQGFLMNDLPLPGLSGEEVGFWDRFHFAEETTCFMSESNLFAMTPEVSEDVDEVWLFDAHHDSGYRETDTFDQVRQGFSCENWMMAYWFNDVRDLHVRYPAWKHWAYEMEPVPPIDVDRQTGFVDMPTVEFDRVFVCRSGAWVPPWLDHDLISFLEDGPFFDLLYTGDVEMYQPDVPRDFDIEETTRMALSLRERLQGLRGDRV